MSFTKEICNRISIKFFFSGNNWFSTFRRPKKNHVKLDTLRYELSHIQLCKNTNKRGVNWVTFQSFRLKVPLQNKGKNWQVIFMLQSMAEKTDYVIRFMEVSCKIYIEVFLTTKRKYTAQAITWKTAATACNKTKLRGCFRSQQIVNICAETGNLST